MTSTSEQLNPTPTHEYFENQETGIEAEQETYPGAADPDPWDPEQIRIHTKHYSLRQVVDMIADGDLDLAPDFQRQFVWKERQKYGLIESLLLGIPLPSFYFNEDNDGRMQVVDGVQRLTTIFQFVHKKSFELGSLAYLHDLKGHGFEQLDSLFRRRLLGSQFVAHVIDPQTPYRVKFDIFRRLNTGGTPLSAQEIRHCMSKARSRDFLKDLAKTTEFAEATGNSLENHPRMADREVILRFIAYRLQTIQDYAESGGLDDFLGNVTTRLDDQESVSDERLQQLKAEFTLGMGNARVVFGKHAFRFWPRNETRSNPINRALFETFGTALSSYSGELVANKKVELSAKAQNLMTDDYGFMGAIRGSTGDAASVKMRFQKVNALVTEVLG